MNVTSDNIIQNTIAEFKKRKLKTILIMFSVYLFWMLLDTLFWGFSFPYAVSIFVGSNLVRLPTALLICYVIYAIQIKIIPIYGSKIILMIAIILSSLFVLSFIDGSLFLINYNLWAHEDEWFIDLSRIIQQAIYSLLAYSTSTGVFYIYYYINVTIKQELLIKESRTLANEAQLLMLRYQINPHFLFNTLNVIQSAIEKDKTRAKEIVGELGEFFRYSLSKNDQMLVTISEEIEAIKKYLLIQKERFGDRLNYEITIDDSVNNFNIPFFLILPLVENSLKFGFSAENKVIKLLIEADKDEKGINIRVKNSGKLKNASRYKTESENGTNTGIKNIKNRMELFYPGRSSFSLSEIDGFVTAEIIIEK